MHDLEKLARKPALLLCCLCITTAALASPSWQPVGPYGGPVIQIAGRLGSTAPVYAVAPWVLYTSNDRGATWGLANRGLEGQKLHAIAVDARSAKTAYLGTDSGLFQTGDGGASWKRAARSLPMLPVVGVATSPRTAGVIYVNLAIPGDLPGFPRSYLFYRSTNGGTSWRLMSKRFAAIGSPLVDASNPLHLFAGIYYSENGGKTWLLSHLPQLPFVAFAADPRHPRTLYAARAELPVGQPALWRSQDFGVTWQPVRGSANPYLGAATALAVDPTSSATILIGASGGVYRSSDGGGSFELADGAFGTPCYDCIADLFFDSIGRAWAADSTSGLLLSGDHGRSFAPSDSGLSATLASAVAVVPQIALLSNGITRWDAQHGWSTTLPGASLLATSGAVAYAQAGNTLQRSADGGETWTAVATISMLSLVIDPADPMHLLGIASTGNNQTYGILRSDDGGATWTVVQPQSGYVELLATPTLSHLYAVREIGGYPPTLPTYEIWRSDDGGSSWRQTGSGAWLLAVDPFDADVLYGVGLRLFDYGYPLLRSSDGGAHWQEVGPGGVGPAVWLDPEKAGHVVLATWPASSVVQPGPSSVWVSDDGLATWRPLGGRQPLPPVLCFASDPVTGALFAATGGGGVYGIASSE